jgi:hypothetical protein
VTNSRNAVFKHWGVSNPCPIIVISLNTTDDSNSAAATAVVAYANPKLTAFHNNYGN